MNRRLFLAMTAGTMAGTGCLSRYATPTPAGDTATSTAVDTGDGPRVAWARRYGSDGGKETSTPGTPGMYVTAVVDAGDGGFVLGGNRIPTDGDRDVLLFRTDAEGRKRWYESYGGDRRDELRALVATDDGGFMLVGSNGRPASTGTPARTGTPIPTREGPWAAKVDARGGVLWQVEPDTTTRSGFEDAVELSDGRFALVGWNERGEGQAAWLVTVTPDGTVAESRTYHSEAGGEVRTMPASGRPRYEDFFTSVCRGRNGGLVVAGENTRGGWVVGTDGRGEPRWEIDLEYPRDVVGDVVRTDDGGYLATGRLYGGDGSPQHTVTDTRNPSDLYLLRIEEGGSIRWLEAYDGGRNEAGRAVLQTGDGGFLAAGGSFTNREDDLFLARTDAAGEAEWGERFHFDSYGGGSASKAWSIPLEGTGVAVAGPDEYVVAAGYMFLKVVDDRSTETRTDTDSDRATATRTATDMDTATRTDTDAP